MPSRKQRRRREKLQRHEWEYVIETEEGEEVVEHASEREKRPENGKPIRDRRGREIPKPSLQRALKRSAIFGPLLAVFIFLVGDELTTAQKLFQVVLLLAVFIPFSYFTDVFMYRAFQRRQAKQRGDSKR